MTISIFAAAMFLVSTPTEGVSAAAQPPAQQCEEAEDRFVRRFHKLPAALRAPATACAKREARSADRPIRVFHKKPAVLRAESAQS